MELQPEKYSFLSANRIDQIRGCVYRPINNNCKGYFLFIHDKYESSHTYKDVMKKFSSQGYICFGSDYVGHGNVIDTSQEADKYNNRGENGYAYIIEDIYKMYEMVIKDSTKQKNLSTSTHDGKPANEICSDGVPFISILGVGMGATIAKLFIIKYPQLVNALVLCGDKGHTIKSSLELVIYRFLSHRYGINYIPRSFEAYIESKYNKFIENTRTGFEWITRDDHCLDRYMDNKKEQDKYSIGDYITFSQLEKVSTSNNWYRAFPKYLSLYLLSGGDDPVNNYTRNLIPMLSNFRKYGAKNIIYKFYQDARHNLLIEKNRKQVMKDILGFAELVRKQQLSCG